MRVPWSWHTDTAEERDSTFPVYYWIVLCHVFCWLGFPFWTGISTTLRHLLPSPQVPNKGVQSFLLDDAFPWKYYYLQIFYRTSKYFSKVIPAWTSLYTRSIWIRKYLANPVDPDGQTEGMARFLAIAMISIILSKLETTGRLPQLRWHAIWTVQMWPFRNLLQFGVPAEWSFKCALIMWMCRVIKVLVIGWIEKKGQWVLTTKKNIRGNVYLMPYCDMIQGFFLLSRLAIKYLSNATFGTGLVNQISVVERLDRLSGLLYAEFNE